MTALRKKLLSAAFATAMISMATVIAPQAQAAFVLANSNGGDGYVVGSYPTFDLFGADNGASNNYTTYTDTFATGGTISYAWTYTTNDCCGAAWDPGGYVLNGAYTQLSPDVFGPPGTGDSSGILTVTINPGDTFGFYVFSPDSIEGRGDIAVTLARVPEPASLAILGAALGGFSLIRRRRRA